MSVSKKILDYLKKSKVKHDVVKHKTVYTAFDLAKTLKTKLEQVAKTLLVKADGNYVLVVMPANYRLDQEKLRKILKAKKVELAKELNMKKFLDTKIGSLTPFGNLHKLSVFLDKALLRADQVLVGAGSFTESLRMKVKDLAKLENATLGSVGQRVLMEAKKSSKTAKKSTKKSKTKKRK